MRHNDIFMTYIGGPTASLDIDGLRLLTDPTFDAGGAEYMTSVYPLRKMESPAIGLDALGPIDVVLLSHDHHISGDTVWYEGVEKWLVVFPSRQLSCLWAPRALPKSGRTISP